MCSPMPVSKWTSIDFKPRADFRRLADEAIAEIRGNLRLLADARAGG